MKTDWKHDELLVDLAGHLRSISDRMVWLDTGMGAAGSVRPDVWALSKSYAFNALAYEIKVSVSDFRSDVTKGKWTEYLKYSTGVIFAVPAGMIKKEDVPSGCGLMTRGPDGWKNVKGPTLQKQPKLSDEVWMKLLMDCHPRNTKNDYRLPVRSPHDYVLREELNKRYGKELGEALARKDRAAMFVDTQARNLEARHAELSGRLADIQKQENELRARLSAETQRLVEDTWAALGFPPGTSIHEGRMRLMQLRHRLDENLEIKFLRRSLENIKHALESTAFPVPEEVHEDSLEVHAIPRKTTVVAHAPRSVITRRPVPG